MSAQTITHRGLTLTERVNDLGYFAGVVATDASGTVVNHYPSFQAARDMIDAEIDEAHAEALALHIAHEPVAVDGRYEVTVSWPTETKVFRGTHRFEITGGALVAQFDVPAGRKPKNAPVADRVFWAQVPSGATVTFTAAPVTK